METIACGEIFAKAEAGELVLAWSFMHEDENALSPFLDRKAEVMKLSELCRIKIAPSESIRSEALALQGKYNLGAKDALHVACASLHRVKYFLTCDDRVQKKTGSKVGDMVVMNPVVYVVKER
jgi:predicted nucleic acid-binding protein